MPVQLQSAVLWAMQKGYVDAVPVDRVKEFQTKLQEYLTTRKEAILDKILVKKQIDEEVEKELTAALDEFKTIFR
jgi:F-type H+-transporting ATPase subunit alpha